MYRVFCLFFAVFLSIITLHPGRTDSNGGHYDRDSGEYHYHHGYPAHQHTNGICPYDFDDKTGQNSGGTSGNAGSSISRSSVSQSDTNNRSFWDIIGAIFLVFVGIYSIYRFVWFFFVQPRLEEKIRQQRNRAKYMSSIKSRSIVQHKNPQKLTPDQQRIFHAMMDIIEEKASPADCINSFPFILATAYSLVKLPIDPKEDLETMAHRVLARSCYSVLLYREKNKIPDVKEPLSNFTLFELMRDSLLWLLRSKYYTIEHYDSIVNRINPVLRRMNLKKPDSQNLDQKH